MAKNGHKTNWLLDATLFGGLLLSFWLDLTGVGWHQWLGVLLGALITYHFLAHWKWMEAVAGRSFGRAAEAATTRVGLAEPANPGSTEAAAKAATTGAESRRQVGGGGRNRIYFLIDLALLAGFYLIGLTGLVISTWLGLELGNYAAWRELHVWISIATLALVVLKIGLHQGWIIATARRYFGRRGIPRPASLPDRRLKPRLQGVAGLEHTQLVAVTARRPAYPAKTGRRDFLILMGAVGGASLLSVAGVLHDPAGASETLAAEDGSTQTVMESVTVNEAQIGSSSSSGCSVICDRRCSYPGHCKRYQDTNGNGRCDWGECA